MRWLLATLLAGAALSACASREMVLPTRLAETTEALPVEGAKGLGLPIGRWRVGEHAGRYERSSRRITLLGLDQRQYAGTLVTMSGPDIDGQLTARCVARRRDLTLGDVAVTRDPFRLDCDFERGGQLLVGSGLRLAEVQEPISGPVFRQTRGGEVTLGEVVLVLVPAYALEGQGFEHASPIGYTVERDGVEVGAIELDTSPRVHLPLGEPALREAVLAAAVPLAVTWDPSGS